MMLDDSSTVGGGYRARYIHAKLVAGCKLFVDVRTVLVQYSTSHSPQGRLRLILDNLIQITTYPK